MITSKPTRLALIACALALLCSAPLCAQAGDPPSGNSPSQAARDEPEEVVVRGRRPADFRSALEAARVRVYDVFNDLNSDDAFDVHCQAEDSTGTRMRQRTCRPQFKDDISNAAATAWMDGLRSACTSGVSQECIFSSAASQAISMAQGEEIREGTMQQRFAAEMARVVAENPQLQQAILDYQAVERAYDEARGGRRARDCDRPEPPARCAR